MSKPITLLCTIPLVRMEGVLSKQERVAIKKARKIARRNHRKACLTAESLGLPPPHLFVPQAALSVANKSLPPIPPNLKPNATTICLCYQYKEPAWTKKQHKHAITKITEFAREHNITGRGRCAPEGLNATLTATASDLRNFCNALREWNALFNDTDFKLSDGEPSTALFRTFTLRKVQELVGYGLGGIKAPSLTRNGGKHLEADAYHEQMKQKDTVIIDVRNAYESAIGHFQPPPGGALLLDPKMRDSTDFPKWLNLPETKAKLKGKTVMMYCTGGIRCERATALLNQMTEAEDQDDDFQTKDVVMARGGIERYLKTYPEGGFWKGKNYLFDKRMEQTPSMKTKEALDNDIESNCCICKTAHASYRGQFKCSQNDSCSVPVIVCPRCTKIAEDEPDQLQCALCEAGHSRPTVAPDLIGQKRRLGVIRGGKDSVSGALLETKKQRKALKNQVMSKRLCISRLPLTITASVLRASIENNIDASHLKVEMIQWIVDHKTDAFFGSAFVQMKTITDALEIATSTSPLIICNTVAATVRACKEKKEKKISKSKEKKRKRNGRNVPRIGYAALKENETWPSVGYQEMEHPPR